MTEHPDYTVTKAYLLTVLQEHGATGLQVCLADVVANHSDIEIKVIDYEA